LLTVSFNQDGGCLAVGTANGFSVHNLHPQYNLSVERSLRGGIGQIEMLFRCNLMALVGGGSDPHAAPHRVLIWDDHVPKEIGELSFRQIVLKVKLRKDAIAVALRDRVYVYHLADLSLRDKIYTADNPYGLLSLSTAVQDMVLACPSVTMGHVRVELYGLRKTMLIEAHESTLRALILTGDGKKLATSSHKGTIIRVWDVRTSQNIYEFRRGVERAQITCLAFSSDDQWLSCSSDKGTTHIFFLDKSK
ncbi:WD40 repeat-like protein, partial [Fragilariopsis cylindrus CCMP1102]